MPVACCRPPGRSGQLGTRAGRVRPSPGGRGRGAARGGGACGVAAGGRTGHDPGPAAGDRDPAGAPPGGGAARSGGSAGRDRPRGEPADALVRGDREGRPVRTGKATRQETDPEILVAVDDSAAAFRAAEEATRLCLALGAGLVAVGVVADAAGAERLGRVSRLPDPQARQAMTASAVLRHVQSVAVGAGVEARTRCLVGPSGRAGAGRGTPLLGRPDRDRPRRSARDGPAVHRDRRPSASSSSPACRSWSSRPANREGRVSPRREAEHDARR